MRVGLPARSVYYQTWRFTFCFFHLPASRVPQRQVFSFISAIMMQFGLSSFILFLFLLPTLLYLWLYPSLFLFYPHSLYPLLSSRCLIFFYYLSFSDIFDLFFITIRHTLSSLYLFSSLKISHYRLLMSLSHLSHSSLSLLFHYHLFMPLSHLHVYDLSGFFPISFI